MGFKRGAEGGDAVGIGGGDEFGGHQHARFRQGRDAGRPVGWVKRRPAELIGMMRQHMGADEVMRPGGGADGGIGDPGAGERVAVVPHCLLDGGGAGLAHADMQDEGLARYHQAGAFAASR